MALLWLAFATGCVWFPTDLPKTGSWPASLPSNELRSMSLVLTNMDIHVNGEGVPSFREQLAGWRTVAQSTYEDSHFFSLVLPDTVTADLRAELRVTHEIDGDEMLRKVSLGTLGLVPYAAKDRITLHTDFKTASGELLASVERSGCLHQWQQLFLVLLMVPPLDRDWAASELFAVLNRATLEEGHAKGIF